MWCVYSGSNQGSEKKKKKKKKKEEVTTDSGGERSDMKRGGGRGRLVFTSKLRIYFDQTRIGGCWKSEKNKKINKLIFFFFFWFRSVSLKFGWSMIYYQITKPFSLVKREQLEFWWCPVVFFCLISKKGGRIFPFFTFCEFICLFNWWTDASWDTNWWNWSITLLDNKLTSQTSKLLFAHILLIILVTATLHNFFDRK